MNKTPTGYAKWGLSSTTRQSLWPWERTDDLLRVGPTALKTGSESHLWLTRFSATPKGRVKRVMLMYKSTLRFLACFDQPEAVTNVAPCMTLAREIVTALLTVILAGSNCRGAELTAPKFQRGLGRFWRAEPFTHRVATLVETQLVIPCLGGSPQAQRLQGG